LFEQVVARARPLTTVRGPTGRPAIRPSADCIAITPTRLSASYVRVPTDAVMIAFGGAKSGLSTAGD
jgi:hypothetical protein